MDTEVESSIDMDSAQESIASDIFDNYEPEAKDPVDDIVDTAAEEVSQEAKEEPTAKEASDKEVDDSSLSESEKQEVKDYEPPSSWKKEMREFFNSADPMLKQYIIEREKQMHDGLEKDRADANMGRTMRDVITPYEAVFERQGLDPTVGVQKLLAMHQALSTSSPEQKAQYFDAIQRAYGIKMPQNDNEMVQNLQNRLNAIEQNAKASHEKALQATREKISAEVDAFAQDHPYFDDLSDDIAKLIQVGHSLEDAYEKAKWSNPVTREKELQSQLEAKARDEEKRKQEELDKANKAKSVNVKGRDTEKAPTGPKGKFLSDDDMRNTLRDIKKSRK